MTDEEIKKGLEKCAGVACSICCPYSDNYTTCTDRLKLDARELIVEQEKEINQLKTECTLLDDELRNARQETINVLNKLKEKAFDKDSFNGWAGPTFVVLVRDIDKMTEELVKCRK